MLPSLRLRSQSPAAVRHGLAGALLPGVLVLAAPTHAQTADDPLAGIEAVAADVLRSWGTPGLALAVVKDGEIVFERGFGVRTLGGRENVDEHTIFAIASTTKAFTAATVGLLVDDNRLSWDDPVERHLPGFRLRDPWMTRETTLRDLMSHRTGLPRGDHLWYLSPFDRDAVVERVSLLEPTRGFREGYGYQNIMFITAGEVVEAVTGTRWDDFLRERILEPAGMERTNTANAALVGIDNVATPHIRLDGGVAPIARPDFDNVGAAGAINSTAHDMARWIQLQLGRGKLDDQRIWSDSVASEMWQPNTVVRLGSETRRTHPESNLQSYGLGWFLQDYRGRLVVRHGGSLDGMRAHVALVPEERLGVVALANLNESRVPVAVVWEVIDRYLEPRPEPKDWNAVLLAEAERSRAASEKSRAEAEAKRVTGTRPTLALDAYTGRYHSELSGDVDVTLDGGDLRVAYGPGYVGVLEHWHYDTWRVVWQNRGLGRDLVTFRLGTDGSVASVTLSGVDTFGRS